MKSFPFCTLCTDHYPSPSSPLTVCDGLVEYLYSDLFLVLPSVAVALTASVSSQVALVCFESLNAYGLCFCLQLQLPLYLRMNARLCSIMECQILSPSHLNGSFIQGPIGPRALSIPATIN